MKAALKRAIRNGGRTVAGMLPAAALLSLGLPALAAVVFLVVLVIGATCWILDSDERTSRVNRILLARRGDPKCLEAGVTASQPKP